jgi:hypothetical protein
MGDVPLPCWITREYVEKDEVQRVEGILSHEKTSEDTDNASKEWFAPGT